MGIRLEWRRVFREKSGGICLCHERRHHNTEHAAHGDAARSGAKDNDLIIDAPELAENGTNVPVTLTSKIPDTDFIALIADHNPNPVCVGFNVMPGTEPYYAVRIKVAETSAIIAVARSGGKWYYTLKDITVMVGGCLG